MAAHPDPERLAPLAGSLASLARHGRQADAELLDQQVIVGDRAAQGAVDALVDDALEALRELTTSCRELGITLAGSADGPGSTPRSSSRETLPLRGPR